MLMRLGGYKDIEREDMEKMKCASENLEVRN
jgi:hypothetical protein